MYILIELALRYMRVAMSLLEWPCVMSAITSDSRSLSPSDRPGQSRPGTDRILVGSGLTTISPWWMATSASTSSTEDNVFERYPCAPLAMAVSMSSAENAQV